MTKLSEIDIFDLLDINETSEEEKITYLKRITKLAFEQAIDKAGRDGLINSDTLEKILAENPDSQKFQEELIRVCPAITEYSIDAVDNMKIEILLKQVDEVLQKSSNFGMSDLSAAVDLQNYLNTPINQMEKDILLTKVNLFRDLQNKMFTKIQ